MINFLQDVLRVDVLGGKCDQLSDYERRKFAKELKGVLYQSMMYVYMYVRSL